MMQGTRKVPLRQCLGCREMKPKKELIRVVRSPEGDISMDFRGKASGRGAYICRNKQCFLKARKSGSIGKALGVEIPAEIYDKLQEEIDSDDEV